MSTHFTPKWRDRAGNVMIFPAANTLFESAQAAQEWQESHLAPSGLAMAGVLKLTAIRGFIELPHVACELGDMECCVIAGPVYRSKLQ